MYDKNKTMEEIDVERRSDKCIKLLQEAAKEILSSVSFDEFTKTAPTSNKGKGTYEHLQNVMYENINRNLKFAFKKLDVDKKIDEMDKIASKTASDTIAQRCTPGEVDISATVFWGLSNKKLKLKNKIKNLDEELEKLQKNITNKRKILTQNTEIIKSFRP